MNKRKWMAVGVMGLLAVLLCGYQTAALAKVLTGTEILAAAVEQMDRLDDYQISMETVAWWQTEGHRSTITLTGKHQVTTEPFGFTGQEKLTLQRTFLEDGAEMVKSYWISQRTEAADHGLVVHQMTDFNGDNHWEEEIIPAQGQAKPHQWNQYQAYLTDVLVRQESVILDEKDCFWLQLTLRPEALTDFAGQLTSLGIDATALQEAARLSQDPILMDLWIAKTDNTLVKQQITIEKPFAHMLMEAGIPVETAAFSLTLNYHI